MSGYQIAAAVATGIVAVITVTIIIAYAWTSPDGDE